MFDVAMLVFACVAANHLGLISAVEDVIGRNLPVINCPKCSVFWLVLAYLVCGRHNVLSSIAASFLMSYLALWLDLIMGCVDYLYNKVYDKIYSAEDKQASTTNEEDADGGLPELQQDRSTVTDQED